MDIFEKLQKIYGTYANVARQCGRSPSTVAAWRASGVIPAEHCIALAEGSGMRISLTDLRPDIYPEEWSYGTGIEGPRLYQKKRVQNQ